MATIEAFEITQRKIGQMFELLLDYMGYDFPKGIQNDWRVLVSSILGSVDMLHFVSFPLAYPGSHPLHLDDQFDEDVELGLINSDLDAPSKESHIWPTGTFDPDWACCPTGDDTYPAWDGYPSLNPLLPDYPESGGNRVPVFLRAMYVTASSGTGHGSIPHTSVFNLTLARPIDESSRDDLYDIRVYRFDSTSGGEPVLPLEEVARTVTTLTDTITVQVGNSAGQTIEEGVLTYYVVFWNSPDDFVAVTPPSPASGSDVTSSLVISQKGQRDLFDSNRYDFINFLSPSTPHYIKSRNHTQLDIVDGNEEGYTTVDPEFYRMPALQGSLDPDYLTDDPAAGMGMGSVWGYGYSLDSGDLDPSDSTVVYGVNIALDVRLPAVSWSINRGPEVYPEFWPGDWVDFAYYPPLETNEIPVAKAIVKRVVSKKEAIYRPQMSVIHLEYYPSYGRQHSLDLEVLDSLIPIIEKNLTIKDEVGDMADRMVFPLIATTPTLTRFQGGVIDSMVNILLILDAGKRFNSYWKNPLEDAETKPYFGDLNDYIEDLVTSYPGQITFDENLCSMISAYANFQPSRILSSFNPDSTYLDLDYGTVCYLDRKLAYPTGLEVALPKKRSCHRLLQMDKLQKDYSIKLTMRNQRLDRVFKETFLSASSKWISDAQASLLLAAGTPRDPYLWPAKLAENPTWVQYGRTVLIPDAMGGESHPLSMRPFDPRDPTLPLYDEFVADLEAAGYTEEQIQDAVTDQEYLHGGFDTVDLNTIPEQMVSLDEMQVGVTMYNETGIPIWKGSQEVFGDDTRTRYGFLVDGEWYYQDFDEDTCNEERGVYVETHEGLGENAKHQTLDAGTPVTEFALNGTYFSLATTFTADFVSVSPKITNIRLKLKAVGMPLVNLAITVNNVLLSGAPGSILQTSDWVPYNSVPLDSDWVEFSFPASATLVAGTRYAICLYSDDTNPASVLDSTNRIEWAYADRDTHSYGMTSKNSKLILAATAGDEELSVTDSSVYDSAPFYAVADDELVLVTLVSGNVLTLDSPLSYDHAKDVRVFEVVYVPSDSEKRWVYADSTGALFQWEAPISNQSYDATYQIDVYVPEAKAVKEVPSLEWSGDDVTADLDTLDTVYISTTSDSYAIDDDGGPYGTLGGLTPLATFNGPSTFGFPSLNSFRQSGTNVMDGYVAWTSNRLSSPSTFSVFPSAKNVSSVVTYIPTEHDMYLTVACVGWDGNVTIVDKFIPAGTSSPVLLDLGEFVGISFLWVQQDEFVSSDTYGFGAGETFMIRSK